MGYKPLPSLFNVGIKLPKHVGIKFPISVGIKLPTYIQVIIPGSPSIRQIGLSISLQTITPEKKL